MIAHHGQIGHDEGVEKRSHLLELLWKRAVGLHKTTRRQDNKTVRGVEGNGRREWEGMEGSNKVARDDDETQVCGGDEGVDCGDGVDGELVDLLTLADVHVGENGDVIVVVVGRDTRAAKERVRLCEGRETEQQKQRGGRRDETEAARLHCASCCCRGVQKEGEERTRDGRETNGDNLSDPTPTSHKENGTAKLTLDLNLDLDLKVNPPRHDVQVVLSSSSQA